jgi:hypothetical protein
MRALLLCASVALVVGISVLACNPNSIGRPCVNAAGSAPLGTQVSSPALECPSRLCLLAPLSGPEDGGAMGARATCTARCDTNDDCEAETTSQCKSGFVCAVATQAGAFCCQKLCVCREDLVQGINVNPDGGVITPFSCDPKQNPTPTCSHVSK